MALCGKFRPQVLAFTVEPRLQLDWVLGLGFRVGEKGTPVIHILGCFHPLTGTPQQVRLISGKLHDIGVSQI